MAAFFHDVFLLEEHALVQVRIEIIVHEGVRHIGRPAYKMVHGALGPVRIVNLEPVSLGHYVVTHFLERGGGLRSEQGRGLQIAVYPLSHKVVGAVIADFQDGVRNGLCHRN